MTAPSPRQPAANLLLGERSPTRAPALWQQLQSCAAVVGAVVSEGRSLTAALAGVPVTLRPGVQALSFEVLRQWGTADFLLGRLATRRPPPKGQHLLQVALALLTLPTPRYDVHTLVNQTIEAAKRDRATAALAGMVNACLRRFLRERDALMAAAQQDTQAHWNHPAWWVARLQHDHPRHWQAILQANQHAAPMTLRVNPRVTSVSAYRQRLAEQGCDATVLGDAAPHALVLAQALPVTALPGFADGAVSVQDAGAQQAAALLLGALPPDLQRPRILDACAAPGGKTAHLLELCDADVTAVEVDAQRAQRIHDTLARLRLQARVITADVADVNGWWDGQPFDAILLDAPCTASGIVRRHPDVRWLRQPGDVAQLAAIQSRLLARLWDVLKPGGHLLYSTCSVFEAEGALQIEAFVAHHTDARLRPSPGHLLPVAAEKTALLGDNGSREHDGFYYALLEKTPPDRD